MLFLNVVLVSFGCAAAAVPSYIKPCARSDPKFKDCTLQHAKEALAEVVKGDRKLGVASMDPLEIVELKQENVPNNAIALVLKDVKVFGFKNTQLHKTEFDFEKKSVSLEFVVPVLTMLSKYDVKGRLLILPITGNGDVNSTTVEAKIIFDADVKDSVRDGKHYWQIENPRIKMEPKRVYIKMTNLFNGNELLGKEMNDFMDSHWKEVNEEVSPPVEQAIAEVVTGNINKLLMSSPQDELFPQTL